MYKVRTHAAANAKAKVILGRLLGEDDFIRLTQMRDPGEIKAYLLSKTHYSDMKWTQSEDEQAFEVLIKKYFFSTYEKFFHFYVDEYRDFIKAMLNRYEVENLKLIIRTLLRGESLSQIMDHIMRSALHSNIDYDALTQVKDMDAFLSALKGTIYYDALRVFSDEDPEHMSFHMEMTLDRSYFNRLYDSILKLRKRDRDMMLELLGINVDILNIQWIYRGRKYFDISSEELFNFTLNAGKLYDFKALKALCYMDLDDYRAYVSEGDYAEIFSDKAYMMERAMERHLYVRLDDFTKHAEHSIAWPVVLIFKFEYEIRDLFTILEAKKYGVSDCHELLIRELKGAI